MTMMLVRGRCLLLVVVTIGVSGACDDCSTAADVGEGDLALLLDVSTPPSLLSSPSRSRCDDDDL